jgi:hypothetical protein
MRTSVDTTSRVSPLALELGTYRAQTRRAVTRCIHRNKLPYCHPHKKILLLLKTEKMRFPCEISDSVGDVAPYSLVEIDRRFGDTYCLHHQGFKLNSSP